MTAIRKENAADIPAIRQVNERAFEQPTEASLVDALRANGKASISLVAESEGLIVGHILFSPVTLEPAMKELIAVGLAPMAVLPEFQNQGIGSLLVRAGLEECRKQGCDFVAVLEHPTYYPRFGFVPSINFNIKSEYDVPDEVFMLLELKEGALSGCSGIVKYQPEFNEV
jgi:putative acetyltransferase